MLLDIIRLTPNIQPTFTSKDKKLEASSAAQRVKQKWTPTVNRKGKKHTQLCKQSYQKVKNDRRCDIGIKQFTAIKSQACVLSNNVCQI